MSTLFAIDLDGVVVDLVSAMLPKLSEIAGREVRATDIHEFDIGPALGLPKTAMDELWRWMETEKKYESAQPVDGAVNALLQLGPSVASFVTGRGEELRSQTNEWLRRHGLRGFDLEMGRTSDKLRPGSHFRALVEDNPTHVSALAAYVDELLIFDQPWNQEIPDSPQVVRVSNWREILEKLCTVSSCTDAANPWAGRCHRCGIDSEVGPATVPYAR